MVKKTMMENKPCRRAQSYPVKNNFNNISFYADTLDRDVLKSVTISMNGWFECDNHRKLTTLKDKIKSFILRKRNPLYFQDKCIAIDTVPVSMKKTSHGFVDYEFTLFTNSKQPVQKREMVMILNPLIEEIYYQFFNEPTDYHVTKNKRKTYLV
jgi:hypothetical protein